MKKTDNMHVSAIYRTENIHSLLYVLFFPKHLIFYWGKWYLLFVPLKPFFNVAKIKTQQFLVLRLVLKLPKNGSSVHY